MNRMSSSELAHSKCSFPFLPPPDFQNMQLKVGSALDSNRPSLSYSPILLEPSHLWMFSFLFLVPPLSVLLRRKSGPEVHFFHIAYLNHYCLLEDSFTQHYHNCYGLACRLIYSSVTPHDYQIQPSSL